jgi:adenine-specific DNA-methyltransferase
MQTLNYIGCKNKLSGKIISVIQTAIEEAGEKLEEQVFGDLFAGTGVMSFNMLDKVKKVISNDLEYYSYVILQSILKCRYSNRLRRMIDKLNEYIDKSNNLKRGLIYWEYSPNKRLGRMFFTNENASRYDTTRILIEKLKITEKIDQSEYIFLLGSLIVSMDKVANTSCVYGAYLKKFKPSSLKKMIIKPIHTKTEIKNYQLNEVYNDYTEDVVKQLTEENGKRVDILYLDPPYNQRQYSGNYSQLNYMLKYDKRNITVGKTGMLMDKKISSMCRKKEALIHMTQILRDTEARHIFISYNNEGIIGIDDFEQMCKKIGETKLYKIPYRKFKSNQKVDITETTEYLWYIKK